jgi:hypothetical protein
MKFAIILTVLLILIGGCSVNEPVLVKNDNSNSNVCLSLNNTQNSQTKHSVTGIQDLILYKQDILQLGLEINNTYSRIEEYPTSEYSPLMQISFSNYTIYNINNNTEVIIELQKFSNLHDLNGSYQYSSSHYYSVDGLISENDFGDQSRFRVNSVNDYGGQFNDPNVYYYHLWISKNEYLIHITSKGSKDARDYIPKMGRMILSKFE